MQVRAEISTKGGKMTNYVNQQLANPEDATRVDLDHFLKEGKEEVKKETTFEINDDEDGDTIKIEE